MEARLIAQNKLLPRFLTAAAITLAASPALAATDLIWSNTRGFLPTTDCTMALRDETAFRVSARSGSGSNRLSYENLRSHRGQILSYLPDGSLVKIISGAAKRNYQPVEIVGVSIAPQASLPNKLAKRTDKGYLHDESLLKPQDFVFEILDAAPAAYIGNSRIKLPGSFWQIAMEGDKLRVAVCDSKDYLLFDVFIPERREAFARVGVHWNETNILRSLRTYDPDEAEDRVERVLRGMDMRASQGDENRLSADEIEINEETGDTSGADDDGQVHPDAYRPNLEDPPIIVGDTNYVTCFESGTLSVRDESLKNVVFSVNKNETVQIVQSWKGIRKVGQVNGLSVRFIEVQFPDRRTGPNSGWVAESFVVARSLCASYQRTLGQRQPIVCSTTGSVQIRDHDLKGVRFNARQFETLALWTGSYASARKSVVDGREYSFIPVVFPERSNQIGWIASDFVKEKGECAAFRDNQPAAAAQITSIASSGCCVFPTIKRPTHSYLSGMRRFRASRSKGRRLHAACDLYRVHGEAAVSIAPGTVLRNKYFFYQGTFALEVRHAGGTVVRYGEIMGRDISGVSSGKALTAGQTLGHIGTVNSGCCRPMLHFEMYSGRASGSLSTRGNRFQRRSDLMDPTSDLRKWEKAKFGVSY